MPTPFLARLGMVHPLIQAPMAGGWTTPALVAAVANAGGLGTLAGARLTLTEMRKQIEETRRLTDRPFGSNFLVPTVSREDLAGGRRVRAHRREAAALAAPDARRQ